MGKRDPFFSLSCPPASARINPAVCSRRRDNTSISHPSVSLSFSRSEERRRQERSEEKSVTQDSVASGRVPPPTPIVVSILSASLPTRVRLEWTAARKKLTNGSAGRRMVEKLSDLRRTCNATRNNFLCCDATDRPLFLKEIFYDDQFWSIQNRL